MILLNEVLLTECRQSRISVGKEKYFSGERIFILHPDSSASAMLHGIMGVRQLVRLSGLQSSQPAAAKSPDCNLENHCVLGQRHFVSLSFICSFLSLLSLSFSVLAVGYSFWPHFCEWLGVSSRASGCQTTTLRCLPKRHLSAAACVGVKSGCLKSLTREPDV